MLLVAETVFAATVLCSTAERRQRSENDPFFVSNRGLTCFNVCTGSSLENKLTTEFENIAAVKDVRVNRSGDTFALEIEMARFDRVSRRQIYAREKELYHRFPQYSFGFCLIDASRAMTTNVEG
jgi:hypothetical protein